MRRSRSTRALISILALGVVSAAHLGCQGEPDINCERVRFGWPTFDESPSSDISAAEGIQIDIAVRSDLLPGARATLTLTDENEIDDETADQAAEGEHEEVTVGTSRADASGMLFFSEVTIPLGNLLFSISADDACGRARTGRRLFVWDGLGKPQCSLSLASAALPEQGTGSFTLGPEHDEDPSTPGMQVSAIVDAGRPDMEVRLFVVDRESGESSTAELMSDQDNLATQQLTLAEGEQALRAICYWPSEDLNQTSATQVYLVVLE